MTDDAPTSRSRSKPKRAAAAGRATASASATIVAEPVRQRIPLSIDPFGANVAPAAAEALTKARALSVANLYTGMAQLHGSLGELLAELAAPPAPARLVGVLLQPDGTVAPFLQVQFDPAQLGGTGGPIAVTTSDDGMFHLPLPPNLKLEPSAELSLRVHGASGNAAVPFKASAIGAHGLVGNLHLPHFVAPLPVSIVAALAALAVPPAAGDPAPALDNPAQLPVVRVGECDDCLLQYGANRSVDRFPYGIFFRLVEPRASIVTQARRESVGKGRFTYLPEYASEQDIPAGEAVAYVERVPVEQPISVDGFRDQLMGLQPNGTFTGEETRPMAGTLGLGYVLTLAQQWTLQGLALGNLVYSLPLAPGEQQQVAIFERTDTAEVFESEFLSEQQAQEQRATADTSTQATFDSAFLEAINGRSAFETQSESSSWGIASIFASGGSGSSSASGVSTQSLQGQRDTTQEAAQTTHSAAENQAAARRSAARTGMRLASASESEGVTTKTITNHNHAHALTMQYWEVERVYDVTTTVEGVTLTVLVPLQVVRFMAPGQPATLASPGMVSTRAEVLARYRLILKHADILEQALPRAYRQGLRMLVQFAADPTAEVQAAGSAAEDVIRFTLTGTFVQCEDVYVTAVTDHGTRLGPVRLTNSAQHIPRDDFTTREQLVDWLIQQRQSGVSDFQGALALPTTMSRTSIVGFEISRSFDTLSYVLRDPALEELEALQAQFGSLTDWVETAIGGYIPTLKPRVTVVLSPAELETALGGPRAYSFRAGIEEVDASGNAVVSQQEAYANDSLGGAELPPQRYPVPARQLPPILQYSEILRIEQMAEHVARRTLQYSHAVWASMSSEERAILLEAYTIGVPPGGLVDDTQMVPLLNCVENRVLGYFGNSMILPFFIPEALAARGEADGKPLDATKIHDALLAYQQATFQAPRATIALPTRGVLGEAVLGRCPSAEKIDITRFWNWQDSPSDTAPAIAPVSLPTDSASIAAGLTAPNSLGQLPSLINNVLTAPTPDNSLLTALGADAASQKDFSSSLTGADQLAGLITNAQNTANSARADALKTTKDLNAQAMATVGNIVGGIFGGNPTAGSSAAAAVSGQGAGTPPAAKAAATPAKGAAKTPAPGAGTTTPAPGGGATPPPAPGGGGAATPPAGAGGGSPVTSVSTGPTAPPAGPDETDDDDQTS